MTDHNDAIHPTAVIAPTAVLESGVKVGPYAVIEDNVQIGRGTHIGPHTVIHSHTSIGAENRIHAHVVLGDAPQHLAYDGAETRLEIGDANIIREMVTMHRAMSVDTPTSIGNNCFIMANSHIGHDCQVGNNVTITNNTALAGHVEVGNYAVLGGAAAVHQFVRIGAYAMVAAFMMLRKDAMPYCMIAGDPARHYRLNSIGLKRNGITGDSYKALESAYRRLKQGGELAGLLQTEELKYWQQWLNNKSKRGISGFLRAAATS